MKINGKEINFALSIGAYCDFNDWCVANSEKSIARANVYKALCMNRAYAQAHEGADTITEEELMNLPQYMYTALLDELKKAEDEGNRRSVQSVEKKQNARPNK